MRKSIIMALGLAVSLAGVAAAQQPGTDAPRRDRAGEEHGRGGKWGRGEQDGPRGLLLKGITLSDAQKTQLEQLHESRRAKMDANRDARKKEFEEMRAARERGDTAAVKAIRDRNRVAMQQEREQEFAAVRNILTADQRVQFDKNVAELKQREEQREARGERVGGRRGRGHSGRVG